MMLNNLETRLELGGLARVLEPALARAAEPERARRLSADVLEAAAAADAARLVEVWRRASQRVAVVLASLMGAAPFFAAFFTRHPDLFLRFCGEDLARARTRDDYGERLARWVAERGAADGRAVLRRFKYYELARITVRELCTDLVPEKDAAVTLGELSFLADTLLHRALDIAAADLASRCGPPRWRDEQGGEVVLRFCALGLGKLGSEELNYSSDVDLIYVFEAPPPAPALVDGPSSLTPVEYFTRLAQAFGRLVGEITSEGFLYRIDLDLRPEGSRGQLVVSSEMLATYYELWAATWERAAFMKARPVAGDDDFGWRTVRAIDPMVYRSAMDVAAVEAIGELKKRVEHEKGRDAETFDVKIGSGGIRDVEFVAQAMQLLHGGHIPQVRVRSTQQALAALAEVGVLGREAAAVLLAAYRFLRRTENRLQMEAERQVHRLPHEHEPLECLARAMGFLDNDPVASFQRLLEEHRQRVRDIFAPLFRGGSSEQILQIFSRRVPALVATSASRRMIENLALRFRQEIDASSDPERALNNFDRFTESIGARRFYYELLLDRPELVRRLTAMFASSEYLSNFLATHPRLIEPIFDDPNVLVLTRDQLEQAFDGIRSDLMTEASRDEVEMELDAIRMFHNRELVNIGLLDLDGKVTLGEAEAGLTDIAEVCLERALALAEAEMRRRAGGEAEAVPFGEFLVVGMGKLASRELTYGSDLDVIFLYDVEQGGEDRALQAQEFFVRLAQKLIWALRTRTAEGVCYDIDARLRPSGNQGMLVTSLAGFEQYHSDNAGVWERQALLRARPVAGAPRLRAVFEGLRRTIVRRPVPENVREEIHRIRVRMERELAREDTRRRDFKIGRGGLTDVESIVQCLQLLCGEEHEELIEVTPIATQIERLHALGLLDEEQTGVLRAGWDFLRRLASRLRIVANRSISDLDEERGDLDALARRLGYEASRRAGARRALLDDYRMHTSAIREVYLEVLGVNSER